ncbi:hypothetical protein [Sphingobacterium faecium]|uniref:hypothetical protein n=1 Tax=Sphingobacterium faecium TaxID=34087 RepID=UPI00247AC49C|nr:hypothetical protein [Sphingobacterium faecium]WGQ15585.1 hypothetical protein QG727_04055 [Sphingobacterium faecium]
MENLNKYISEIILLITTIGGVLIFMLKTIFSSVIKKKEIKYNLFYKQKIMAIEEFMTSYRDYNTFFNDVSYFDVRKKNMSADELDSKYLPFKYNFQKKVDLIKIYLDKESRDVVDELNRLLIANSKHLRKLLFPESGNSVTDDTNDYLSEIWNNNKKGQELVDRLVASINTEFLK